MKNSEKFKKELEKINPPEELIEKTLKLEILYVK